MEQNFQTSFIPKKPIVEERTVKTHSIGLLTVAALFVLFTVLIASGGIYFYKKVTEKNIEKMANDLTLARNRFEPAKIAEMQILDKRLRASNEILMQHIAVTPVFQALQDITMKTVQYTKFGYTFGDDSAIPGNKIAIKMSGVAVGYLSIALQSDLFTQNRNLIDPVFSNLSLDDKGNVIFDLEFSVDPSFVDYKVTLPKES